MPTKQGVLSQLIKIMGTRYRERTRHADAILGFIKGQPQDEQQNLWADLFTYWTAVPNADLPPNEETSSPSAELKHTIDLQAGHIIPFFEWVISNTNQPIEKVVENFLALLKNTPENERTVVLAMVLAIGEGKVFPYWQTPEVPKMTEDKPEGWTDLATKAQVILQAPTLNALETAEAMLALLDGVEDPVARRVLMMQLMQRSSCGLNGILASITSQIMTPVVLRSLAFLNNMQGGCSDPDCPVCKAEREVESAQEEHETPTAPPPASDAQTTEGGVTLDQCDEDLTQSKGDDAADLEMAKAGVGPNA